MSLIRTRLLVAFSILTATDNAGAFPRATRETVAGEMHAKSAKSLTESSNLSR